MVCYWYICSLCSRNLLAFARVIFYRSSLCTSSFAQAKIIIRAKFALFKLIWFTSSKLEYLSEILKKLFELDGVVFWSDIQSTIIDFFSRQKYLRKLFLGDFDIYITIVCFEKIIVFWLMLFDHIVFQIECFAFVFDDEEIEFFCFLEHFLFSERIGRKILSDSFLKVFGFAYVKNRSLFVFEKIDSWSVW